MARCPVQEEEEKKRAKHSLSVLHVNREKIKYSLCMCACETPNKETWVL
jgi:hypothetical protein